MRLSDIHHSGREGPGTGALSAAFRPSIEELISAYTDGASVVTDTDWQKYFKH